MEGEDYPDSSSGGRTHDDPPGEGKTHHDTPSRRGLTMTRQMKEGLILTCRMDARAHHDSPDECRTHRDSPRLTVTNWDSPRLVRWSSSRRSAYCRRRSRLTSQCPALLGTAYTAAESRSVMILCPGANIKELVMLLHLRHVVDIKELMDFIVVDIFFLSFLQLLHE